VISAFALTVAAQVVFAEDIGDYPSARVRHCVSVLCDRSDEGSRAPGRAEGGG
jgi:hypothetical protein